MWVIEIQFLHLKKKSNVSAVSSIGLFVEYICNSSAGYKITCNYFICSSFVRCKNDEVIHL